MIFIVPGTPEPLRRTRVGNGRHYTDARTVSYKNKIALYARQAGVELLEGPVRIELTCYWRSRRPDLRFALRATEWMDKRPDIDNILKVYLDALQGIAFLDDGQVARAETRKLRARQGDPPEVVVEINPIMIGF